MTASKETRIKKEIGRLKRLLKNIPKEKLNAADGVIKRMSFMQITLENLEEDINKHGTVETFSQTKDIEYIRERPETRIYNAMIKNYTAACKQLFDLLPDGDKTNTASDELMDFVKRTKR